MTEDLGLLDVLVGERLGQRPFEPGARDRAGATAGAEAGDRTHGGGGDQQAGKLRRVHVHVSLR